MIGRIYKITNTVNGMIYIGQTQQTLERRFSNHKTTAPRYKLSKALKEFGANHFIIELLEDNVEARLLLRREQFYIDHFHSTDPTIGYNVANNSRSNVPYVEKSVMVVGYYDELENQWKMKAVPAL